MSITSSTYRIQRKPVPFEITGNSDDLEVASKTLSHGEKAVLQVIDAPYDGSTPQVRAVFSFDDDIAEGLKGLPPHSTGTARILDVTTHSDFIITGPRDKKGPETTRPARDVLIKYLQDTYTQPFEERRIFRWLNDPVLVNDIGSISSQWSQRLGGRNINFYRLINRTSLQQNPLDLDLYPRDSYLTCAQDSKDRLIAIIVNDVWSGQTFSTNPDQTSNSNKSRDNDILFQNPRSVSNILAGTSWTSLSDGNVDTFAKLLVLDFFFASIYLQPVDYYSSLIYSKLPEKEILRVAITKNPHLQVPLGLFEPRLSAKSREAFKEIEHAEGILRSVNNLVDSIHFVVAALKSGTSQPFHKDYERRMHNLEGLCKERGSNAQRALDALNRQLDYLTKRHSIREAKSIKVLTILASLYLPLSLSASVLGMQTPFKGVAHTKTLVDQSWLGTNLLFDFFGVFIGLATVTIFILYAIKLGLWLKSEGLGVISRYLSSPFSIWYYGKKWRFGGTGGRVFEFTRVVTRWWVGAGMCITLLVIFLVGMLHSAQVAWDTAKWMFTTYLAFSGVCFACYAGTYGFLYYKMFRRR